MYEHSNLFNGFMTRLAISVPFFWHLLLSEHPEVTKEKKGCVKGCYRKNRNECSFKFAWPNITLSINLISTENKRKQLRIAKFIYIAFKKSEKNIAQIKYSSYLK